MNLWSSWRFARNLTGRNRTASSNRILSFVLAFVAGATNAGGFLAVQQYTSHMTGIVSAMADAIALGSFDVILTGVGAVMSFLAGAACTSIMISYARRHNLESEYAMPLLLEAFLLLIFGMLGARLNGVQGFLFVPVTVALLCFIMGLQNAVVTQFSGAQIRTTHVTGTVTDIGIELGQLFYWNRTRKENTKLHVRADRLHLQILSALLLSFFLGAVVGDYGFKHVGYISTVWLALMLVALALSPIINDVRIAIRLWKRSRKR